MPQRGGGSVLTGDATVSNVRLAKTFYSNDPSSRLTGIKPHSLEYTLSVDILKEENTEIAEQGDSYKKKKTIKLWGLKDTTTIRTLFAIKSSGDPLAAWGRIYKNGVAVGTERERAYLSYADFTEDLVFSEDDLMQVYIKSGPGSWAYVGNFKALGIVTSNYESSTP